jgi:hypothetical protein
VSLRGEHRCRRPSQIAVATETTNAPRLDLPSNREWMALHGAAYFITQDARETAESG